MGRVRSTTSPPRKRRMTANLDFGTLYPLFDKRTGVRDVSVVGYSKHANAYVVRDNDDNGNLLVLPESALSHEPVDCKVFQECNFPGFRYRIGSIRPFPYHPWVLDDDGVPLDGESTECKVVTHVNDNGNKWYLVWLEDTDDRDDEFNWWNAYDIRPEAELSSK